MRAAQLIELPDPEWLNLVRAEVEKPGNSITKVAAKIGMSRSGLSMLLSGKYPAKLDKMTGRVAARAVELYAGKVLCPHVRSGITPEECQRHASAPMTTSHPEKLRQWSACRRCPQNPVKKQEEK